MNGAGNRAPRVLVVGWHGSAPRQLRPIARAWESLGACTHAEVPRSFRAMSRARGWQDVGETLTDTLAAMHAVDPRPLVFHTFSNAGFWTLAALLAAAATRAPALLDAHVATALDSAPGFPAEVEARFTAQHAAMAMMPGVLATLGKKPAHRHPALSPLAEAFFFAWHHLAHGQVRFMEASLGRVASHHAGRPLLALYGDRDELVPHPYVEAFCDLAATAGARVTRRRFEGSPHVRHLAGHRRAYTDALAALLEESLGRGGVEG